MKRRPVGNRGFTRSVRRVNGMNYVRPMRGGIRL